MAEAPELLIDTSLAPVAVLRINRPPNNFITQTLVSAIADAYESLGASHDFRAIVLAAEGKNFCAGADFAAVGGAGESRSTALPASSVLATYSIGARLIAAPLPVVAAVTGAAVGGGLGLACTADFRVGSRSTRLASNFATLGVHHGFGLTVTLPPIAGFQRANELLFTGRRIGGEEAARLGLLDRLVEDDRVLEEAIAFAKELAAAAPLAVRAIRSTMRQGLPERFLAAAEHESKEQARLGGSEDFREGVSASNERRAPRFLGR